MSKENLIQFMNQVTDSEELQNRIGDEIDTDALIALGAAHGCKFTAEDLTEYAELSDEELDSVAGGGTYEPDMKVCRLTSNDTDQHTPKEWRIRWWIRKY